MAMVSLLFNTLFFDIYVCIIGIEVLIAFAKGIFAANRPTDHSLRLFVSLCHLPVICKGYNPRLSFPGHFLQVKEIFAKVLHLFHFFIFIHFNIIVVVVYFDCVDEFTTFRLASIGQEIIGIGGNA